MLGVQILIVLVAVAFFTLMERKILGYIQRRKGPNKPGFLGVLTPFADALKLITKEQNKPSIRNYIYYFTPFLALMIPLLLWSIYNDLSFKYSVL